MNAKIKLRLWAIAGLLTAMVLSLAELGCASRNPEITFVRISHTNYHGWTNAIFP